MILTPNEQQKELVRTIHELCEQEIKPYYLSKDFARDYDFDWHLLELLGELNLICPTVPVEYGGLGLDIFTVVLIMEEISTVCPSLATIIETNIHFTQPLLLAGSDRQKEEILPKLTGKKACINSFALTEPTGGSDINSMTTCAERISDSFLINGRKDYVINAPEAEYISLFAFTDPSHKKSTMRCFVLPRSTPGIRIGTLRDMSVLDYVRQAEIIFDNVKVTQDMVLKEEAPYSGYFLLTQTFDSGRVLTAATSVGIAQAAYKLTRDFANQRIQFNRKIIHHQAISYALVDMATKIEMARLLTWKACQLILQGEDFTIASAMAKLSATTIAQEVTAAAADILGASSLIKGSLINRLCNDARMLSIVEGTNNIQRNIIASLL